MKLGFNIVTNENALWVQVLRSKYRMKEMMPASILRSKCSFLWKALSKISNISPLIQHIPSNVNLEAHCKINEVVKGEGVWNLDLFRIWLSEDLFPIVGQDNITIPTRKTHSENKRCPSITTYQAGDWILGYNHYLGKCSMFEAELWGILDGLTILNDRRYERVLIHIYSMEVLKTIEYRQSEDNRVVDGIAKLTFDNKEGVLIFEE
ncbi:hypothetical protein Golax_025332, partial [Gossypium laxum]|nr:hypothetical protein [Gossypium laxum]